MSLSLPELRIRRGRDRTRSDRTRREPSTRQRFRPRPSPRWSSSFVNWSPEAVEILGAPPLEEVVLNSWPGGCVLSTDVHPTNERGGGCRDRGASRAAGWSCAVDSFRPLIIWTGLRVVTSRSEVRVTRRCPAASRSALSQRPTERSSIISKRSLDTDCNTGALVSASLLTFGATIENTPTGRTYR